MTGDLRSAFECFWFCQGRSSGEALQTVIGEPDDATRDAARSVEERVVAGLALRAWLTLLTPWSGITLFALKPLGSDGAESQVVLISLSCALSPGYDQQ